MFKLDAVFIIFVTVYAFAVALTFARKLIFMKTTKQYKNNITKFYFPSWFALIFLTLFTFLLYLIVAALGVDLRNGEMLSFAMILLCGLITMIPGLYMILFFMNTQVIMTDTDMIEYNTLRRITRYSYSKIKYSIKETKIIITYPKKGSKNGAIINMPYSKEFEEFLRNRQ